MDFYSNLKSILKGEKNKAGLKGVDLYVIRSDGTIVYTDGNSKKNQAIGALVCGAWQATSALLEKDKDVDFRFSFDTSSSGIYILSLMLDGQILYLASIFENEMNPGRLKIKMRKMRDVICEKLDGFLPDDSPKDSLLFEGLSDDEVNNLFSFGD